MGSYHGKAGFDTFTHYKSIVNKKTWMDLPVRYQLPESSESFLKLFSDKKSDIPVIIPVPQPGIMPDYFYISSSFLYLDTASSASARKDREPKITITSSSRACSIVLLTADRILSAASTEGFIFSTVSFSFFAESAWDYPGSPL